MIYKKKDNVVARRVVGEMLLVPIRGTLADLQRVFVLEGAGEFIWDQLDGARTLDQIRKAMATEFEVAPEQAARDLEEFIAELRQRELIVEVS